MVERLVILKTEDMDNNNNNSEHGSLSKGHSFNTDDDDSLSADTSPAAEDMTSTLLSSVGNFLSPLDQKRSLLSLTSPSMDSVNDPDGSVSDNPLAEKIKRKRQRRTMDKSDSTEVRRSRSRKLPWYLSLDYTKPLMVVAAVIIIYLMVAYYKVWIPRLLTSNTRVRHSIMVNEEKLSERHDAHSTTKDSSLSDEDDTDNDDDDDNDQSSIGDDDDSPVAHKPSQQKLNLRVRRNKMSFSSKDRPTKKKRGALSQTADGDDDDDDNIDDDNSDDDVIINSIKVDQAALPSSIHSSKKHQHRSAAVREQKIKIPTSSKTNLIVRHPDDIVQQLQKLLKSRGKNRDLLTTLTKETGLNKAKINQFIHGKNYSIITLDTLISVLNSFDSTLLIVSK